MDLNDLFGFDCSQLLSQKIRTQNPPAADPIPIEQFQPSTNKTKTTKTSRKSRKHRRNTYSPDSTGK